jgi:hypothetical protein
MYLDWDSVKVSSACSVDPIRIMDSLPSLENSCSFHNQPAVGKASMGGAKYASSQSRTPGMNGVSLVISLGVCISVLRRPQMVLAEMAEGISRLGLEAVVFSVILPCHLGEQGRFLVPSVAVGGGTMPQAMK